MNGISVLTASLESSRKLIEWIVADFTDDELLVRPVPEANHFAWQLGHLICAERAEVIQQLPSAKMPELPAGFVENHSSSTSRSDGKNSFLKKDEYLTLLGGIRTATISELQKLSDGDLDRPTIGSLAAFFPTLGSVFSMFSDHILMHLGQATVIRRKLGKPVLF